MTRCRPGAQVCHSSVPFWVMHSMFEIANPFKVFKPTKGQLKKTSSALFFAYSQKLTSKDLQAKNTAPSECTNRGRYNWCHLSKGWWTNAWGQWNFNKWMIWTSSDVTCAWALAKRAEQFVLPWIFFGYFLCFKAKKVTQSLLNQDVSPSIILTFANWRQLLLFDANPIR